MMTRTSMRKNSQGMDSFMQIINKLNINDKDYLNEDD